MSSNLDTSVNGTCDKLVQTILRRQACFYRQHQSLVEKQNSHQQVSFLPYHHRNDDDDDNRISIRVSEEFKRGDRTEWKRKNYV